MDNSIPFTISILKYFYMFNFHRIKELGFQGIEEIMER